MIHDKEYNNSVTIVKAIGIILMVLAHSIDNPPCESGYMVLWKIIYSFHMPLFFIMSGYCFKEKYLSDAPKYVLQKIKGIYLPFAAYSLGFLLLHNVFCSLHVYDSDRVLQWQDVMVRSGRIVIAMVTMDNVLGTFWFLKELFWGSLFFYLTLKCCSRVKWVTPIVLLIIAELFSFTHFHVPGVYITSQAFYAAVFISIGYIIRVTNFRLDSVWKIIFAIALVAMEVMFGEKFRMQSQKSTDMVLYIFPAIAGTMLVYELAVFLEKKSEQRILSFIGNHTFVIMALHLLSFKLVSLLIIYIYHLPIEMLATFPVIPSYAFQGWWIIYTIIGMLVPLSIYWLRETVMNHASLYIHFIKCPPK